MNNILINNLNQKSINLDEILEISGCNRVHNTLMPVPVLTSGTLSNCILVNDTKLVWPYDLLKLVDHQVQVITIMASSPYKDNRIEFVSGIWYIYHSSESIPTSFINKCLIMADVRRTPPIELRHSFSQSV